MHVVIDTTALSSGHLVRGIGSYTDQLIKALEKYEKGITYTKKPEENRFPKNTDIAHYTFLDLYKRTLIVSDSYKTIVTIHDVIPLVYPDHFPVGIRGKVNLFLQKRALRKVSAVITDSHNSKNDIARYLDIPAEKITVIYLAADEQFKKLSARQLENLDLGKKYALPEKYFLYVGDVNWNKNLPRLLEAYSKVQDRVISLVMVGKALVDQETTETRELISHIEKRGLEKRVFRFGFLPKEDLVGVYNAATGYIQPSLYEGFGLPVLEAMQCGVPVISSNVSSLPELTGNAAIQIDPRDVNAITEAIRTVLHLSKSERSALVDKGYHQAKKFTWEKVAHDTAKVYYDVYQAQ